MNNSSLSPAAKGLLRRHLLQKQALTPSHKEQAWREYYRAHPDEPAAETEAEQDEQYSDLWDAFLAQYKPP